MFVRVQRILKNFLNLISEQSATLVVPFYLFSTPSIIPNTSILFFQNMNKEQAIWQRDTLELQASRESCS